MTRRDWLVAILGFALILVLLGIPELWPGWLGSRARPVEFLPQPYDRQQTLDCHYLPSGC